MARVELQGVVKSYDGKSAVVHGIDLTISHGKFVVFVGPSGCGKSTLLRMVAGLEDISAGTVLIDGERVNDQVEAMTLADRICVLSAGHKLQYGTSNSDAGASVQRAHAFVRCRRWAGTAMTGGLICHRRPIRHRIRNRTPESTA